MPNAALKCLKRHLSAAFRNKAPLERRFKR